VSCDDGSRVRVRLRVTGLVQGVFYRQSAASEAGRLGLAGSVRNMADGSVEVVAEGARAAVEGLVAWCRRGPPSAHVASVDVEWQAPTGEPGPFAVRR
jgi:acylphosphatase